jgi:hypothetical protein
MKIKKKDFDIFSLAFLDIISCGFGAVILLVLISNTAGDVATSGKADAVESLLDQVARLESRIESLAGESDAQKKNNDEQLVERSALGSATKTLVLSLAQKERAENTLAGDLEGLSLVQSTLERMTVASATSTTRDEEVGGIPVDSDYVIFIVDTSGSMLTIWERVAREIVHVLQIHPQVKGFQILNDQGKALVDGYSGRWIPDTPQRRKSVMQFFAHWRAASNSSPVEGIQMALKRYAGPGQSTAIYVFGDDYTGSSYDPVIAAITEMNRVQPDGRRLAKIHAVGFLSKYTTGRFAILMREMTKENGGTFLALPM